MLGKRHPVLCRYTVGYTSQGLLTAIKMDYYVNCGYTQTDGDGVVAMALTACDAAYHCPVWLVCRATSIYPDTFVYMVSVLQVTPHLCKTNAPPRTWCRAPGVVPAVTKTESSEERKGGRKEVKK